MSAKRKRSESKTALLVVHGMGSQRPLATLRGIVDAVWRERDDDRSRRIWLHPELSGTDIDLPVITTNAVPADGLPKIDFHEFYWSHLMSETRAVAVLLWLFELVRKGPRLNPGIGALWWGSAVFLSFLLLSVVYLAIQGVGWFAGISANRGLLLVAPVGLVATITLVAAAVFALERAFRLAKATVIVMLIALGLLALFLELHLLHLVLLNDFATRFLAVVVAGFAIWTLMGLWGLAAFGVTCVISSIFYIALWLLRSLHFIEIEDAQMIPWSLDSQWSLVLAWLNVVAYLIFNAMFLQPYLGDAARYFRNAPANTAVRREIRRQAVEMLSFLHASGKYDRIIIVAHSLGSVIAYDMLRAYFARVAHDLPTGPEIVDRSFDTVDSGEDVDSEFLRTNGRQIVRKIALVSAAARENDVSPDDQPKTWLVTDFVSLGSPLTHAYYLMCDGETAAALQEDFQRRVREREFPTCPPLINDGDGRLTFIQPGTKRRLFHHGSLFGLTRWTNLYFPVSNLFWGDAIGGKVGPVFGKAVKDVPIYVRNPGIADFFSHITYWDIGRGGGRAAPHIQALRDAINLADRP